MSWLHSFQRYLQRLGAPGCAVLFACLPMAAMQPQAARAQSTIHVGISLADDIYLAPIFAAGKLGLFKKAGLVVRRSAIRSLSAGVEALAAGHVDMIDAPSPAVTIAKDKEKGLPGKIVATNAEGFYGWTVIVKNDSAYQSLADLRGKTLGISAPASLAAMAATLAMERGKVDFTVQAVGAGSLIPMLRQRKLDAVVASAMVAQREVASKRARIAYDLGFGEETYAVSTLIASNALMAKRPAELRAFLAAVARALTRMQSDRKWSIEVLKEYANIVDIQLVERMHDNIIRRMKPGGATTSRALRSAEALAARAWDIKGLAWTDAQSLYTNDFVPKLK